MAQFALQSQRVITPEGEQAAAIVIENEKIVSIEEFDSVGQIPCQTVSNVIMPALVDCHVHINEPGRTDWEGFDTATHAAAAGGIATLVDMPLNCIPVTTSQAALQEKLDTVDGKLWVDCAYWGGATADNLADLPQLLASGVKGVKSFTIHSGIDEFSAVNRDQLRSAMRLVAEAGLVHLVHAELDTGTDVSEAEIGSSYNRFLQSRPKDWENAAIQMVIDVMHELKQDGLNPAAHIVHLSSAEAIAQIAKAQDSGLRLSAETCPHYLALNAEAIPDGDPLYKCCPPIREHANKEQLWQGIIDGTISCIVSDHSPCTANLKALDTGDLGSAWGGIAALQFGLPLIWTEARPRDFDLYAISVLMSERPAQLAGLGSFKGKIAPGYDADFCVFDDKQVHTIVQNDIHHKNKFTPYLGRQVTGVVKQTWLRGHRIYNDGQFIGSATGKSLLNV